MKHESDFPTDPELEARIVAWVLGEASPFEAAELERRVAADPQLAIFKRRIEAVHGLLGEAVPARPSMLRLSPERRAKLLAVIGEPLPADEPKPSVLSLPLLHQEKKWQVPLWAYSATAACLLVGVFIYATLPHFALVKHRATNVELPALRLPEIATEADREAEAGSVQREVESRASAAKRRDEAAALDRSERAASHASAISAQAKRRENVPASYSAVLSTTAVSTVDAPAFNFGASKTSPVATTTAGSLFDGVQQQPLIVSGSFGGGTVATYDYYSSPQKTGGTLNLSTTPAPHAGEQFGAVVTKAEDGSEVVKLSPFEVRAEPEAGYNAATTLAGNRLNTELRDIAGSISLSVPVAARGKLADTGKLKQSSPPEFKDVASAVSVVSKDFLRETGATSNDKLLAYTSSATRSGGKKDAPVVHPYAPAAPPAPVGDRALPSLTRQQSVSTFSLHVGDVSYKLAQAALAKGEKPDPAAIRPEEFYNAFDYGDPAPVSGEPVACRIEQAAHPVLQQRNLVRIGLRVPAVGREAAQPLRLTVLLDTSGSMEREDRVASVHRAFDVLASLLGANDRVTVIGFARQPRLLAENVPGTEAKKLVELIAHTPADGGTNFEEALKLAAEQARSHFESTAQNRIVAISDGAANLGADDPSQLSNQVAALRQEGIAFDACGVGIDGLDDSVLEALTRKGDGRYYVINSPEEADVGFARKLAGALHPEAQNVKVQVRFNPARVESYRLIGFEQHRLREEDFRNDKVAAAELAGDEAAVALYEVQPKPDGEGELGDVFVRFRNTATGAMVERSWTLMYEAKAPGFEKASPSLQLAGMAALLAEKLQGRGPAGALRLGEFEPIMNHIRGQYAHDRRVLEFVAAFEQARRLYGD